MTTRAKGLAAAQGRSHGRVRFMVALGLLGVAVGALASTAPPAPAAFPGQNGKIAFDTLRDGNAAVYVMNASGSGPTNLTGTTNDDFEPAWSADGQRIAFTSFRDGHNEIYVMNANGSGQTNLTNNASSDDTPAWSPDGQKIAFTSDRDAAANPEVYAMNANGSGQTNLTNNAADDREPAWSPDGQKIAFERGGEIFVMNADGSGQTNLTNNAAADGEPAWSPDGQRIAFRSESGGNAEVFVMNANGSVQTNLTNNVANDREPAWSPDGSKIAFQRDSEVFTMNANGSAPTKLTNNSNFDGTPDWQPLSCPDVQVGFAAAQGCFTETAPGSGIFQTTQKSWVGGFEIQPRPGGTLVVNTNSPGLSAGGAGVDVVFAGFAVPIPVAAIPVGTQNATFNIGTPGTLTGVLDIPVESTVKLAWSDCAPGGQSCTSATYEQEIKLEELTAGVGQLVTLTPGQSVGAGEGKLKAKLVNGTGFVLESGEISIDEVNLIPRSLRIPRTLKLVDLLLKFETKANAAGVLKPFWTGRAGIGLPLARGQLDVTGTGFVFDGTPAGGGFEVDGINKQVLGPLFLQKAGGDLLFSPDFGMDLRIGATVGPQVRGQKLVTLDGTVQGGALVSGCGAGPDPAKLEAKAKLPAIEQIADVDITQRACIFPGTGAAAAAIEGTLEGEIDFFDGLLGYKGTQSGFVSTRGASYEGTALVSLPALPDLDGTAILSSVGLAACTDLAFFEGGVGYHYGNAAPSAFSGCDLGLFRVPRSAPALAAPLAPRATTSIKLPKGLPHAGFAATGTTGAPPVKVTGPGGFSAQSPADGSALRSKNALIVPVAHEATTYVFVDDPKAGRWRLESLDPANPLGEVGFAPGLAEPKLKGKVTAPKPKPKSKGKAKKAKKSTKFTLDYTLRPIAGQKVTLTERGEGIANELGKAKGPGGTISFKPTLASDRKRTIEAEVIQNGIPREILTIARFKAPPLPKLKVSKLKAKRKKSSLVASWAKVAGSSEFLVEVQSGSEVLFRVLTAKRKLRFATPAKGKLKLSVQALSESRPPGPVAKLKVKKPK